MHEMKQFVPARGHEFEKTFFVLITTYWKQRFKQNIKRLDNVWSIGYR